jgi:hypothetical protein
VNVEVDTDGRTLDRVELDAGYGVEIGTCDALLSVRVVYADEEVAGAMLTGTAWAETTPDGHGYAGTFKSLGNGGTEGTTGKASVGKGGTEGTWGRAGFTLTTGGASPDGIDGTLGTEGTNASTPATTTDTAGATGAAATETNAPPAPTTADTTGITATDGTTACGVLMAAGNVGTVGDACVTVS